MFHNIYYDMSHNQEVTIKQSTEAADMVSKTVPKSYTQSTAGIKRKSQQEFHEEKNMPKKVLYQYKMPQSHMWEVAGKVRNVELLLAPPLFTRGCTSICTCVD